jgi:hypothetical protein
LTTYLNKIYLKLVLTSLLALLLCLNIQAQSNFHKMTISAGVGITQSFADVVKNDFGTAGYGTFDYYLTPFLSLGFEGQMGEINGGDAFNDPYNRQFTNRYKAFNFNGKVSLGALIDYERTGFANAIKGLYIGAGAGVIMNSMKFIQRINTSDGSKFPGLDNSKDLYIPLNLGINFNFMNRSGYYKYGININYQSNITLGEGLDGYDDSSITFKNGNPDIYTYFSLGFRYHFGSIGLSSKTLY